MEDINKLYNQWGLKLIISSILMIFSPFKIEFIILLVFIIIDTITGCLYAVRIGKFTSRKLKKGALKTVTYFTAIAVVRLLEVGLENIISTTMATRFVAGYLVLTEAISILENLTLLDVPLPVGVIKIVSEILKIERFETLFKKEPLLEQYLLEIDEIVEYQIPIFKNKDIQKLLQIKFEEWKKALIIMDVQLKKDNNESNELFFLRVSSLIISTKNTIKEKWAESEIPQECITEFNNHHNKRVDNWIKSIKEICYSQDDWEKKKKGIIEKTMNLLYQTIVDAQKQEDLYNRSF